MNRRFPIGFSLFVLAAVPVMIALGIWQLGRAEWKAALIARLAANRTLPPIELPGAAPGDLLSFRRVHVTCTQTAPRPPAAARAADGRVGYRQQLWCQSASGAPVLVSLGVAADPHLRVAPPAGIRFTGPLVPRGGTPPGEPAFLLVAENPVAPLRPEAPPTLATIANNHRSYALQWFAFAATLLVIYALFLRGWRDARAGAKR